MEQPPTFIIGQRVKFSGEKQTYRVRAADNRFAILTRPFNPKHTVIYTIIDLQEDVRGTENLIFCEGFETDQQCREALQRLQSGETEVSHRNRISLGTFVIKPPKPGGFQERLCWTHHRMVPINRPCSDCQDDWLAGAFKRAKEILAPQINREARNETVNITALDVSL